MKKLLNAMVLGLSVSLLNPALSHSEKPRHGGTLAEAKDLNFELVSQDGKAVIYILDHGIPVDTAKASGSLTVLNGTEKTEIDLQPAGDNRLASADNVLLTKGTKAIASLALGDKKVSVRFSLR